jgi:hypothetical protein
MNLSVALMVLASSWTHVPDGAAWIVPDATLEEVQSNIKSAAHKFALAHHVKVPKWSGYSFQFQGRYVDGRPVVFVNAYCWKPDDHPEDEFVIMSDGGACYFETSYDPKKKSFGPFAFHGSA